MAAFCSLLNLLKAPYMNEPPGLSSFQKNLIKMSDNHLKKVSVLVSVIEAHSNLKASLSDLESAVQVFQDKMHSKVDIEVLLWGLSEKPVQHPAFRCVHATRTQQNYHHDPLASKQKWIFSQLAEAASGDLLIFVDSNVLPRALSILHTYFWVQNAQLDLFSALPKEVKRSLFEKALFPWLMQLRVLGLIPLGYVPKDPLAAFANDQWFAIRKKVYEELGGFRKFTKPGAVVDLAREAVKQGFLNLCVLGASDLSVRRDQKVQRYAKSFQESFLPFFKKKELKIVFGFFWIFTISFGSVVLWFLGFRTLAWVSFLSTLILRSIALLLFDASIETFILHPVGGGLALYCILESLIHNRQKEPKTPS